MQLADEALLGATLSGYQSPIVLSSMRFPRTALTQPQGRAIVK